MFLIGYSADISIAGIPLFFVLFIYTFLIWIVDFKSVKKYYNRALFYFLLLGFYYIFISFVGGFSLVFNIPLDKSYIFRQAYFIPFLAIAIPVFSESFKVGLFNYFLKNKLFFVIFAAGLRLPYAIQFATILVFSINNHFKGLVVFLFVLLYHYVTVFIPTYMTIGDLPGLQILLMQGILFIFFITRLRLNIKYLSAFIIILIFSAYFIQNELMILLRSVDDNAGWRLFVWVDNIKSTINDTSLFGHGFGTTYFAAEGRLPGQLVESTIMRAGGALDQGYSAYEVEFVRGQHNSFINIFYRLGIAGLLLFLSYFITIAKKIKKYRAPRQLNYVLLISMIIIGVNVGLESPGYATMFAFFIGLVQYYLYTNTQKNIVNQSINIT